MRYKGNKGKYWNVFSEYIRVRDFIRNKGKCVTCNKVVDDWKELDAGHYVPAGECGFGLLFDEMNVHGQCRKCNRFQGGRQAEFTFYIEDTFGKDQARGLWQRKWQTTKEWSDLEYQKNLTTLQDRLKTLKIEL